MTTMQVEAVRKKWMREEKENKMQNLNTKIQTRTKQHTTNKLYNK